MGSKCIYKHEHFSGNDSMGYFEFCDVRVYAILVYLVYIVATVRIGVRFAHRYILIIFELVHLYVWIATWVTEKFVDNIDFLEARELFDKQARERDPQQILGVRDDESGFKKTQDFQID